MNVDLKVPVLFEQVKDYDSRFQQVKIWLMHLGKNFNKSKFSKEVVLEYANTVKNTPILGFIEETRLGDLDFAGHETELIVKDGEVEVKYLGQAFGLIHESCNPRFETKVGDDLVEREYLVVDGLLWTKFNDAVSILTDSEGGEVAQSMELHDEYDGFWDEEGYFNFTKFSFNGACMLGRDVLPAMERASVEQVFSISGFQDEINKKLEEFQTLFSKKTEGVQEKVNLEELLAKYSVTVESLAEKGINVSEYSIEELETKLKEFEATEPEATEPTEPEEPTIVEPTVTEPEAFTLKFELSHDDIRRKMWDGIDTHMATKGFENEWFYLVSVFDNYIIAEDDNGSNFYKVDYLKENDSIQFGDVVQVHPMFLTVEEKGALELMRSNFEAYETENKELKEFKSEILKTQHESEAEQLFDSFTKLNEEDVKDIKENVHEYSIEQIESKLYEILGRKTATFSKKEPTSRMKVTVKPTSEEPKGGYSHLFAKHGIKK